MVKTKRRIKSVISLLMAVLCMTFICVTANAALNVNWMRNVLAADNTWFNETTAGINRSAVTEIDFAAAAPASYAKSWNADAGDTGAVKCYLNGTVVTVVGDGANGVYAHKDSTSTIFSGFTKATTITGLNLLHLDNVAGQTVILPSIDVTLYQFLGWSTSNLEWIPERTAADAAIAATSNSYSGVQTNLYAVMKLLNKCEITGNPSDKTTVYNESTATLTVSAVGGTGATMSYQWQESTDGGNSWSDVVGATSDSYTTPISKNAGVYQYRCVVKSTLAGDVQTATSNAATVTINKANSIISFVTSFGTITATTGQSNVSTNIAFQKGTTPITIGTISDNGAGTVSVSNIGNNTGDKIAVTTTSGTIKVTPLKQTGTTTPDPVVLTISVPEGTNYKAAYMKVNVYVTEKPNVNVSYSTTTYTSSNVVMTVDAKAFLSEVTGITTPQDITDVYLMIGGEKISFFANKIGTKYTYTFTENGKSTLYVCDNYGGIYTENIDVDWIDKTNPTYTCTKDPDTWTAGNIELTITGSDAASGYAKMQFNGSEWKTAATNKFTVTVNGSYTLKVVDVAGNTLTDTIVIDKIDRAVPNAPTIACKVGSATIVSGQWINNGSAILTFSAESNIPSGISGYRYSLDGGTTWTNGASVTVSDEGKYTVKAKTISTTGIESPESTFSLCIDKTKPAFALTKSETGYTSNDVTVAIKFTDNLSGIKNGASSYEVTYASGDTGHSDYATWVEDGEIKLSVDIDAVLAQNGTVAVNVVDNAGNSASGSIKVENIDKTPPETPIITAKQGSSRTIEHNGWANGTVTLTFTGDYTNLSGVGSYKYSLDGGIGWISTTGNSIVIDSEGLHSIIVKAVSNTGIDSAPTAPFAFGIDLTDPTVSLSGNPTSWVQSATITATPADTGGSGVAKVFYYDALNNPIELEAPFTHVFTENGTYTFEVRDVSGNIGTKTVSITKVDSEDPVINDGLPRIVEIASGRSFAIIHLLISDQGPSGIASVTLPDGSVTANTEVNHKVYGNGDYKVMSVDNAGNTAERTVHVSGLIMSNDTSLSAAIYTENAADTCSLANGENHLFTIDANGSENAELELAALDPGAKIVSINNVAVNTAKHTATFSLPADEERLFTVVVEAADGTTDIYDITVSAKNLAPQIVSIVNGTNIRKSWYTEEGIVLDHNYTKYQAGHEGIEIQITAFDANRGQYISGYVTFNGINYDIEWGSAGSGVREFVSQGKERKGYVIIPVRAFYTGTDDEDLSNTYAYITLQDAKSSGGDRISTSDSHNNNVRIRTDVTGPVVIIKSASTKYAIRVGLSDTTYINSAAVTLTPKNGPNAGIPSTTEYSHSELTSDYIYLEDGINYDITVTAVDVAGHSTTVDRTIGYMGGVANIGGDDIPGGGGDIPGGEPEEQPINSPIVVDFANTSGNVYRYKTRRANYVLIGGSGNSNAKVITPSENFALLARDILGN